MRTRYLSPEEAADPPPPYRTGEAGVIELDATDALTPRVEVTLSANSVHALIGHGVVDALNALPVQGRVGSGLEALIPPAQVEAARSLFYEADRATYGGVFEFVVARHAEPSTVEYRIRIDNREYQVCLARLQFLCTRAAHDGRAVWIRI